MHKWIRICGVADRNEINILLAHNPKDFDVYEKWGADIVFSGHTHGGMIRIFNKGIISTDRTLFPKYDGGVFDLVSTDNKDNQYSIVKENDKVIELDDSKIVVSRGMSKGHIGFRLFNRPELVVIYF